MRFAGEVCKRNFLFKLRSKMVQFRFDAVGLIFVSRNEIFVSNRIIG